MPCSVMVFTLNEEINLPACLDALDWCDDVILIDSFSTDGTLEIAASRNLRVFQNEFLGFGSQRNWAIENAHAKHPWVLVLDADEQVPEALAREIEAVTAATDGPSAYRVRRRFYLWGRWLRWSSLYPNWVVRLVQPSKTRYVNRGHAETQEVDGEIEELANDLIDQNFKGINEWFERQLRYAGKEAAFELENEVGVLTSLGGLFSKDPLRRRSGLKTLAWRLPFRGSIYFLYSYFLRGGFLDGRVGFEFCRMKSIYQATIASKKYDLKRKDAR